VPTTNTAIPATATTAPTLTAAPTKTATAAPATPTQAPVAAAPANADNCVKCHTSQETLQKLAKAEEPAEKLSEGEG
jgi:mono/diheme cytochrome c family protein